MIEHFWQNVEGNSQDILGFYERCVAEAPVDQGSYFVEVGAWKGKSAAFMGVEIANSGKPIIFDVVDMWEEATHLRHARIPYEPARMAEFLANVAPAKKWINAYQGTSVEIAARYNAHTLDMVYIDADHSYEAVKKDIAAWWPKVKPGGRLAGHDYCGEYQGVVDAVEEAAKALGWTVEHEGITWIVRK